MKRILILIIGIFFSVTIAAHAQLSPDISLTVVPNDPLPLQRVTITAESFGVNLDQASMRWTYNDRVIDSGTGRKSITITAPAAGTMGTITLSASGIDFSTTTTSLVLRPASVDLLWEAADSYTPPFYKGKALPVVDGLIRVTAVPSSAAPKQLVYTWSRNDTVLGSLSGYGKSSLLFRNDSLNANERIAVSAQGGSFTGTASTPITPGNPSLVVYQKNEGFIDYANGASNSIATGENGLVLRMEPFFFSVSTSIAKNLGFAITEGEIDITNSTTPNELYLSAPGNRGSSVFTIAISTLAYTLQNLTRNLTITFN